MPKYHIITYGCQMNKSDSEKVAGILESLGYIPSEKMEEADLILLNTCSVRERAEEKVFGKLGELRKLKKKNQKLLIGIFGCMAQRMKEELIEKFPHVDFVLGSYKFTELPKVLESLNDNNKKIVLAEDNPKPEEVDFRIIRRENKFQAWIPIIYGCNNFCTYCIVPYLRGKEKSRDPQEIIKEIEHLANQGVVEVTLLGQNVDSYGKDLGNVDLADLLVEIHKIPGIKRIRFLTSHPRDVSDKLINVVATHPKICPHWHLPLQAGSDRILRRMGRGYTYNEYKALIEKIRAKIPRASFSTDIIVGFPGEEEEDFLATRRALEEIKFDTVNLAIYSKRPGTPAASYDDPVPYETKKKWFDELENLQRKIIYERNLSMIGKEELVLAEGVNPKNPKELSGRTENYRLVFFEADRKLIGKFLLVRIIEARLWSLRGEAIREVDL
ncbi:MULTISPECIES: tRNA (N6-isopentenyl adenosine(37)-C2)-methylthiotransferase MiaB [Dictyoglomus]|uniref:tRNA-2-methylthio-N(6)-dimethylallyladenosine synthase n=1 Tax=Dictyoglomus turgidum (strain DSM 6724 / Z-1310) TaxID=515635 RepID=B8E278_DICTD|nr:MULTISPECIES: tRNA (N6-isopentenyl adenosine(37)-C2)-methylthiotransferase MiaB [Dictyoglomus]ACK42355.1 RNA modification enzyme, MiaB family [Dictyoglomus turgidum DSM 6724]HBU32189.1 tRNA (N6-isopentenyl adenosine(37)-C2)-methylthiotransferase MiaB [Dictyoglomus sp.]